MKNTPGFVDLGRLSQTDVDRLYEKGSVYAYCTSFPEIDCVSLTKAIANKCIPVVNKVGAFTEKMSLGTSANTNVDCVIEKDDIDKSISEGPIFEQFVSDLIKACQTTEVNNELVEYIQGYDIENVCKKWVELF